MESPSLLRAGNDCSDYDKIAENLVLRVLKATGAALNQKELGYFTRKRKPAALKKLRAAEFNRLVLAAIQELSHKDMVMINTERRLQLTPRGRRCSRHLS